LLALSIETCRGRRKTVVHGRGGGPAFPGAPAPRPLGPPRVTPGPRAVQVRRVAETRREREPKFDVEYSIGGIIYVLLRKGRCRPTPPRLGWRGPPPPIVGMDCTSYTIGAISPRRCSLFCSALARLLASVVTPVDVVIRSAAVTTIADGVLATFDRGSVSVAENRETLLDQRKTSLLD
jgi:hypothetical protein